MNINNIVNIMTHRVRRNQGNITRMDSSMSEMNGDISEMNNKINNLTNAVSKNSLDNWRPYDGFGNK